MNQRQSFVRACDYLHIMFVREFEDGLDIDQVLLVRDVEARQKRDGSEFLKLTLADKTGCVPAMIWDRVAEVAELARPGAPVRVMGRYGNHSRYGPQINVRALRAPAPDGYSLDDLLDGPTRAVDHMEEDLRQLVGTVQNSYLRRLLDRVFGDGSPAWERYREAPAAKYYHQAYRHGLLEHSLGVAQAVSAISATFPGIDRDVAVTGALLHDIGKLDAYTSIPHMIDLTDAGRLEGEIPLGYYKVRRLIEDIEGFPADLAQAVLHIILSHHG
ncbi:MAG: 3-5 exoribonuclease, partial [Solirubrobacteraceae bacterium]|nr:3-5 exoribonuclease [Solirubrobacteraceae bacterium]